MRNAPYTRESIGIRERHNERKNAAYSNPDVIPDMSYRNVHFKACDDTYLQRLDSMLEAGIVSDRGLKQNAKVFGELVFDVNTEYFEQHGGYAYAQDFYDEAYRFAEELIGQQYILSAVLHADERNRSLSEQFGYDVYHYHLHVVYIPVVDKDIKWSKRCKDKSLVGTTKEVIKQISHSKKWASPIVYDEHGNRTQRMSYSILQDQFHDHMKAMGYEDIERGEVKSSREHLDVVSFKVQQESERLSQLQEEAKAQQSNLHAVEGELENVQQVVSSMYEIDTLGKQQGDTVILDEQDHAKLKSLAKEGLASRGIIDRLRVSLREARDAFDRLYEQTRDFRQAMRIAPNRVRELLTDIFQRARERRKNQDRER